MSRLRQQQQEQQQRPWQRPALRKYQEYEDEEDEEDEEEAEQTPPPRHGRAQRQPSAAPDPPPTAARRSRQQQQQQSLGGRAGGGGGGSGASVDGGSVQGSQASSHQHHHHHKRRGIGRGGGMYDEYGFALTLKPPQQLDRQACLRSAASHAPAWSEVVTETGLNLPRPSKLKKMLRLGVPPPCRPLVWSSVSGADELRAAKAPDYFQRMYRAGAKSHAARQIQLDLPRTFPGHPWIQGEEGQLQLRHVLMALAAHLPQLGYCQGLNHVAGLMLVFMDKDEESTFYLLATLVDQILYPHTYSPHLAGCHVEMRTLSSLIGRKLPRLHQHLTSLECDVAVFSTDWFLCLFAISLPSESVARVWDALFNEGTKILFRVALALLQLLEPYLLECDNSGDILMTIKAAAAAMHDHDRLMKTAFNGIGGFPMKKIVELREVHQADVERMVRTREAHAREERLRRELKARREDAERRRDEEAERMMDEEIEDDGWLPQLDNVFNMAKKIVAGGANAMGVSRQSSQQGSVRGGQRSVQGADRGGGRAGQAAAGSDEEDDDEEITEQDVQERELARQRMETRQKLEAMRARREARLAAGTWTEQDEEAFDLSLQELAQSAAQMFKGGAQAIRGGAAHISKGLGVMGGIVANRAGMVASKAREAAKVVGDAAAAAAAQIPGVLDRPTGADGTRRGRVPTARETAQSEEDDGEEEMEEGLDDEEEEEEEYRARGRVGRPRQAPAAPPAPTRRQAGAIHTATRHRFEGADKPGR